MNKAEEYINKIEKDVKHPLHFQILSNPKIKQSLANFFETLLSKSSPGAIIELDKRIKKLQNKSEWLSTYAELRVMYLLLNKGLNAEFLREEKNKSTPDIKIMTDPEEVYVEVKSLIPDGISEEINKTFELEKIPTGKFVTVQYKVNDLENFEKQIEAIARAIDEIRNNLIQKRFADSETPTYKVEFDKHKFNVDPKKTYFALHRGALFINEDYIFKKTKRDLIEKIDQIKSRDCVILFYVSNDWRYDKSSFERALYGNIKVQPVPEKYPELYPYYMRIQNIKPDLIPSQSLPEKDGMFWEKEAEILPAVAIITKWDEDYSIFCNPFCEKSDLIMQLKNQGKI